MFSLVAAAPRGSWPGTVNPGSCGAAALGTHCSCNSIASPWFSTAFGLIGLCSNLFALCVLLSSSRKLSSQARSSFLIFPLWTGGHRLHGAAGDSLWCIIPYHFIKFSWATVDPGCHLCNFLGFSMVFFGQCPLLLGPPWPGSASWAFNQPLLALHQPLQAPRLGHRGARVGLLLRWGCCRCWGWAATRCSSPASCALLTLLPDTGDVVFCLLFALLGILSVLLSFVLNTVSVGRRDSDVGDMVICWLPLLVRPCLGCAPLPTPLGPPVPPVWCQLSLPPSSSIVSPVGWFPTLHSEFPLLQCPFHVRCFVSPSLGCPLGQTSSCWVSAVPLPPLCTQACPGDRQSSCSPAPKPARAPSRGSVP
uniref:Uncharacterized protein n=1 Tax=Malurus cyaneus samueli TaxID=2593467 RepID=A0A8C5U4Q8_9PASS